MSTIMYNVSSLPAAIQRTIGVLIRRTKFWHQVPGDERYRFWETQSPDGDYSMEADLLVDLTTGYDLAYMALNSPLARETLDQFKKKLRADWETSKVTPYQGEDLARLLAEYHGWFDRVFFFGLLCDLTMEDGAFVAGENRIIRALQLHDIIRLPDTGESAHGIFNHLNGTLMLSLKLDTGEYESFEQVICALAHEMVHAYLTVLVRDTSPSRIFRDLHQDSGHGIQFYNLLHFILANLALWVDDMPYVKALAAATSRDSRSLSAQPALSDADAMAEIRNTLSYRGRTFAWPR
ncbi:hypothetical protein F5Y15DRAFT_416785 [Xylariaceae sp. FL0016]|nr:hypothetical protein F5Y15DRAFT_416785 [Xylariaceae sp. FL0016]